MKAATGYQYTYVDNAGSDEPVIFLNDVIGRNKNSGKMGIDPDIFIQDFRQLDRLGRLTIWVHINSPQGEWVAGYRIYQAITKARTRVFFYNYGHTAGIGALIFQAGKRRIMHEHAVLDYSEAADYKDGFIWHQLVNKLMAVTGKSEVSIMHCLFGVNIVNAAEAKKKQLIDKIEFLK